MVNAINSGDEALAFNSLRFGKVIKTIGKIKKRGSLQLTTTKAENYLRSKSKYTTEGAWLLYHALQLKQNIQEGKSMYKKLLLEMIEELDETTLQRLFSFAKGLTMSKEKK